MQRATLAAATLGLALAIGTLQDSTADHGSLAAVSLSPPPSATPNTPPEDIEDGLAQLADNLTLLAQSNLEAEEGAMLAEMLAEYREDMEPTKLAEVAQKPKGDGWDYDSKTNHGWVSKFPKQRMSSANAACKARFPYYGVVYEYDYGSFWSYFRCCHKSLGYSCSK